MRRESPAGACYPLMKKGHPIGKPPVFWKRPVKFRGMTGPCPGWVDAVEKVLNCFAADFPPKDETRDDCSSICPQANCRSHRRVHCFMMLPPQHICRIARTYGSETFCSVMQKDFFDNIGYNRTLLGNSEQFPLARNTFEFERAAFHEFKPSACDKIGDDA